MGILTVRDTIESDAQDLAPRLRKADQDEIRAIIGWEPAAVLARCPAVSEFCYTVVNQHGRAIGMFGVAQDRDEARTGRPWAVGSKELTANTIAFYKESRLWLRRFQEHYHKLWNFIDARNEVHLNWLGHLGFKVLERREEYGVEKRPFYRFEWTRSLERPLR